MVAGAIPVPVRYAASSVRAWTLPRARLRRSYWQQDERLLITQSAQGYTDSAEYVQFLHVRSRESIACEVRARTRRGMAWRGIDGQHALWEKDADRVNVAVRSGSGGGCESASAAPRISGLLGLRWHTTCQVCQTVCQRPTKSRCGATKSRLGRLTDMLVCVVLLDSSKDYRGKDTQE